MGSSVLVGIASTKFIGVIVLAFAPSTLFKLYYFRMYLFIILLGLFNGLMFLPLVLRWVGPEAVSVLLIKLCDRILRKSGSMRETSRSLRRCAASVQTPKLTKRIEYRSL